VSRTPKRLDVASRDHRGRDRVVERASTIEAPADWVWDQACRSATLHFVSKGLVRFVPRDRPFPAVWAPGEYRSLKLLFGFIPIGSQTIRIEFPPDDGPVRRLRDNGDGTLIRTWDHLIEVSPDGDETRYSDHVVIDAGVATPVVAAFASLFYKYRQRRWKRLATSRPNAVTPDR
jgi:hypothetical protein